MMNLSSGSSRITRLEDGREEDSKSARTIIIQGNNESETNLQGTSIELEERGVTRSTFRSDDGDILGVDECHGTP